MSYPHIVRTRFQILVRSYHLQIMPTSIYNLELQKIFRKIVIVAQVERKMKYIGEDEGTRSRPVAIHMIKAHPI